MRVLMLSIACVGCLALSAGAFQVAESQPPRPGDAAATDPLLVQPPKSPEDDATRLRLALERLDTHRPTTQPATQPTDEASIRLYEARTALYREWEAYLAQVQRVSALRESIGGLQSQERLQELTKRVEELKQKTGSLQRKPLPISATEDQLAEVTAAYRDMDAKLLALSDVQSRRMEQIAAGFKQQHDSLEVELKNLRQARQELQAAISAAATAAPSEQERVDLERRRLNVQVARTELTLQAVSLESTQTELASKQDEQYLEALREYVVALRKRMNALREAKSRGTLEVLALKRQAATLPHEIVWLDVQYFAERLVLTHFRDRNLLNAIKDRFPESMLNRLRDRIVVSAATWEETIVSLGQRTGQEAMELRQEAQQERKTYEGELAMIEGKLGQTLSELQELKKVRDKAVQRFRELDQQLGAALASAEPAERTRIETELTSCRANAYEAMKNTIAEVQELATRLKEASTLTSQHVSKLHQLAKGLYRTALTRRESGLAGLEWSAIGQELRQLRGWAAAPTVDPQPASAPVASDELFPSALSVAQQVRGKLRTLAADFRSAGGRFWGLLAGGVILFGGFGALLTTLARHRTKRLAVEFVKEGRQAQPGENGWHAADRAHLFGWKLARDVSLPVAIVVGCWVAAWISRLASSSRASLLALLGFVIGTYASIMLVRALFQPHRPRERVWPCTDVVARHYRYWLTAAVAFSALVLLVPLILFLLETAPAVRALFWEVFKTGLLVMLLLFLAHKTRVLGDGQDDRRGWLGALLSALYPLLIIGVLVLLVLQVVGYGVLVGFVGRGVLTTIAILIVIGAVVEYICDLLDRFPGTKPTQTGAEAPTKAVGAKPTDTSEAEHPKAHRVGTVAHFLRLVRLLVRLAGLVLAIVLILRAWELAIDARSVNWSAVGLSALVVVIALVIDRIVYAALFSLHASGRMPESTTNIIRRWIRGLLALLTILFVIALAGYQITNIWTLLATGMAMVAVGFFAVWSVLSNILSTLIILIWRPFNVGEEIEIQPEGIKGEVVDINFMYTLLKSEGNERTSVPNTLFMQKFIRRKPPKKRPRRSLAEQLEAKKPVDE